jgi:hypothetical protein
MRSDIIVFVDKVRWLLYRAWVINKKFIAAFIVIAVAAMLLFFFNFESDNKGDQASVEQTLKLNEFYDLCQQDQSNKLLDVIFQLQSALDLADEIEASNSLTAETSPKFNSAKLAAMRRLCALGRKIDLPETAEFDSNFEKFLASIIDGQKQTTPELSATAHSAIVLNLVSRYLDNPDIKIRERLKQRVAISVPELLEKKTRLDFLTFHLQRLAGDQSEFKTESFQLLDDIGAQYKSTGNEIGRRYGSVIHDQLVLRGRDIEELCFLVSINDSDAIEELKALVSEIASAKHRSPTLYWTAIKVIEKFDQCDLPDIAREMKQEIEQSIDSIDSDSLAEQAKSLVADYDKRSSLESKKIDLSVLAGVDGRFEVDEKFNNKHVVVFFHDASARSKSEARAIHLLQQSAFELVPVEFLVISIPENVDGKPWSVLVENLSIHREREQKFDTRLRTMKPLENTFVVPASQSDVLSGQIPILSAPYAIVLDAEHKVLAANLPVDQIRNLLKKPK